MGAVFLCALGRGIAEERLSECFGVVLGVEVEDLPGAGGVVDFPGVVGGAVEDVKADVFGFDTGFNHASYVAVAEPAYEAAGV